MFEVVHLAVLSLAVFIINSDALDTSGPCKNAEDKAAPSSESISNYGSCACGFTQNYGCFLSRDKPEGLGCRCFLTGSIYCPYTSCFGRLVQCTDPLSNACKTAGMTKVDCRQGVKNQLGNCNGYADATETTEGSTSTMVTQTTTSNPPVVRSSTSEGCRRWCRDQQKQYYCCEEAHEPVSTVDDKTGECPEPRPKCPGFRESGRPTSCSSDGGCEGDLKCCYDTCLEHHTCKPPIINK